MLLLSLSLLDYNDYYDYDYYLIKNNTIMNSISIYKKNQKKNVIRFFLLYLVEIIEKWIEEWIAKLD